VIPIDIDVSVTETEVELRLPLEAPWPAKSGKTMIIASSHGFRRTTATFEGKPVIVSFTACIERK
jgi:hypothetical protein